MAHLPALVNNEKVKRSNTCKRTSFRACACLVFLFNDRSFTISCDDVM